MNSPAPHQPTSPAVTFGMCALLAAGGALLAGFVWLLAILITFGGALFIGVHWTFVVMAALMLTPGLLAISKIAPLRWIGIGFVLPTVILLALVALMVATGTVPTLPANFS